MTDAQILALAITVLAILGGTIVNNSRIGDVKEVLRAELKAHRAETDARFSQFESRMDSRFNSIDRKLDELIRIMGDHDTRIAKLGERPR